MTAQSDVPFPETTLIPGWRERGEPDPFGTRYDCEQTKLAGGQLTDDMVAYDLGMLGRHDLNHEMVLSMGKDRIRWLSRRLHKTRTERDALKDEVERLRNAVAGLLNEYSGVVERTGLNDDPEFNIDALALKYAVSAALAQ